MATLTQRIVASNGSCAGDVGRIGQRIMPPFPLSPQDSVGWVLYQGWSFRWGHPT